VNLRNKVNHGISYSLYFEEYEACVAAGLDLEKWDNDVSDTYDKKFKERVIAWYQLHEAIKSHGADAQIQAAKRAAKKGK
jgi:hypothetical protein